jgi:hypothetical protein
LIVEPTSVAYHWERQSGSIRSVLRKDNVARLWRDWGKEICPDQCDYLRESLLHYAKLFKDSRDPCYTMINFSRGREAEKLASFLCNADSGFTVDVKWEHGTRDNDAYYLWIPQLLPVDAVRHPRPFIYLVDEYPQLEENSYWFRLRKEFAPNEVIVDHNGNIVSASELA